MIFNPRLQRRNNMIINVIITIHLPVEDQVNEAPNYRLLHLYNMCMDGNM